MFQCKICGKEYKTGVQLGGHMTSHLGIRPSTIEKRAQRALEYEKNPRFCLECGGIIPYSKFKMRKNMVFCCGSCGAKHSFKAIPNRFAKKV